MTPQMNLVLTLTVEFTKDQFDEFVRPIAGTGGGQNFVRKMQDRLKNQFDATGQRKLTITGGDVDTWFRYRDEYGDGGFQSRLGRSATQQAMFKC